MFSLFIELLEEFKKDRELYNFSILTNGILITDEIAKKLAGACPLCLEILKRKY